MTKTGCLVAGSLFLMLTGCSQDADVEGEWDLTLSLLTESGSGDDSDVTSSTSYQGRLSLRQMFNQFEGTGYVVGPDDADCRVEFLVEGDIHETSYIPIKFDFAGSACQSDELIADASMIMQLIDQGMVLTGHNTYIRDNQRLYASASLRLYD